MAHGLISPDKTVQGWPALLLKNGVDNTGPKKDLPGCIPLAWTNNKIIIDL